MAKNKTKILKIFFFNDQRRTVQVIKQEVGTPPQNVGQLESSTGKQYEIKAPIGSAPYIKIWDSGIILISYFVPES